MSKFIRVVTIDHDYYDLKDCEGIVAGSLGDEAVICIKRNSKNETITFPVKNVISVLEKESSEDN